MFENLRNDILTILPMRVWRTYQGGKLIEEWHGTIGKDGEHPEEWIGSDTEANNADNGTYQEGLSKVLMDDGTEVLLKDIIESDPGSFLGKNHVEKFGSKTAVLVKLIDSSERLSIQVHPDRKKAKQYLNSNFGKTECWYVMGGRNINGEPPYILLGFKKGVTKDSWKKLFDDQDIQGMINALNRIELKQGETYMLEGGVPHAIGPGCFILEIQEPTDYTIRVERTTPSGRKLPDELCHQGAGFDNALDCFNYEGCNIDEVLSKWNLKPEIINENDNVCEMKLVGDKYSDFFSMTKVVFSGKYEMKIDDTFSIGIVISGEGSVNAGNRTKKAVKGSYFFIPASIESVEWICEKGSIELLLCQPPK